MSSTQNINAPALFDPARLQAFVAEHGPPHAECVAALELIQKLITRRADGTLASLSETKIEQSFNELLFAVAFGYRTLFRDGEGEYHLKPKGSNPHNRRLDDFSLGFFDPDGGEPIAVAELKSPDTDLDVPQRGPSYRGASPVAQAHDQAIRLSKVQWVLVSNFDEMRLYRLGDRVRYEGISLSEILTPAAFRHAHALFSKETLLGNQDGTAPLERLFNGDCCMILARVQGRSRLVQIARPESLPEDPLSLPQMHDVLTSAVRGLPNWGKLQWLRLHPATDSVDLHGDRLVANHGPGPTRIELTNSGVLQVSSYVPLDGRGNFDAKEVVGIHAMFLILAATTTALLTKGHTRIEATLHDVEGVKCMSFDEMMYGTKPGTDSTHAPARRRNLVGNWPPELAGFVRSTIGELLFPFEIRDGSGNIQRLAPAPADVDRVVAEVR